jgi:hypothetical protein
MTRKQYLNKTPRLDFTFLVICYLIVEGVCVKSFTYLIILWFWNIVCFKLIKKKSVISTYKKSLRIFLAQMFLAYTGPKQFDNI